MFKCGIASIELEGNESDWSNFSKLSKLAVAELVSLGADPKWQKRIVETIDQIATDRTPDFWKSLYRWASHSGGAGIDGWITLFFPVMKKGNFGTLDEITGASAFGRTRNVNSFPSSMSSAPVTCDDRGRHFDLSYVAGQIGTHQNEEDGSVSVAYGWGVFSKPKN